jgi:hypothetical protein
MQDNNIKLLNKVQHVCIRLSYKLRILKIIINRHVSKESIKLDFSFLCHTYTLYQIHFFYKPRLFTTIVQKKNFKRLIFISFLNCAFEEILQKKVPPK